MEFEKTIPLLPHIGRYQITRELGRGTMGIVYEAFDPKLERSVALKTVRFDVDLPENKEFVHRFQREAKSAGRLNHPNIVTIHDAGEENGISYIAMEFLEGNTLRDLLDSGIEMPVEEIISHAIQIAEGLDYAHRFGIVHRDIKPGNIVISQEGRVKISDFGIAQMASGDLTQAGTVLGTPKYMSPEQVRGERLDGRSDIFSLGVILYEMFVGKAPFLGDSLTTIMYKIINEKPANPGVENPECPPGVCQVIARCLAKDKKKRYTTAGEVAADLRNHAELTPDPALLAAAFTGSETSPASPPAESLVAEEAPRRNLLWILLVAAILLTLVGSLTYRKFFPLTYIAQNPVSAPAPGNPQPAHAAIKPGATEAAKQAAADSPSKPAKQATPDKQKGFWARQVDCVKRGICDKPVQPAQQPVVP